MHRNLRFLLALITVTLVAAGGVGLRALHLTAESTAGHARVACASHTDHAHHADPARSASDHGSGDHDDHDDHDGHDGHDGHDDHAAVPHQHDESTCATCELLLTLATTTGADAPVPAFHALVAVASWPAPAVSAAPLPIPALAARPPPTC